MEYLSGGIQLHIPPGCFPMSTDSMALAWFSGSGRSRNVLDLGSGCATLGMLLCARSDSCRVTGIELDPAAHEAALENIRRNALEPRLKSICADLRQVPSLFPSGSFDICISNPPYFSGGPAAELTAARREDQCSLKELTEAAAWALKYGGDFYLVHRPERLGEILVRAGEQGLEAKRLGLLRHREDGPVTLILLQLRKGAKPGLRWEEFPLRSRDGSYTSIYKEIYQIQED